MSLQQEAIEAHKARRQRIEAAAWKPPVKPAPVVVAPPPEPPPVVVAPEPPPVLLFPTIRQIQLAVCLSQDFSFVDLISKRRTANIVLPRQIAMYLCKTLTLRSLPEIGRHFGGKDHTTVLHAVRKIATQLESDPMLVVKIEEIKQLIGQAHEKTPAS